VTDHIPVGSASPRRDARRSRRPTIRDVAALAGVSHQTVSRVINGDGNVRPQTRARVLKTIDEINYVPSPLARGLIANRTQSIGMVTTDVSDHSFAEAVAGAEREARRRGYYLMVASVEETSEDDDSGYLRLLLERRIEGLILARAHGASGELVAASAEIPIVTIGPQVGGHHAVDVDNPAAAREAVGHLLGRGHRSIAMVTGPADWPAVQSRIAGYQAAHEEWGADASADLIEHALDWSPTGGQAATARLLARGEPFTALFAHSDLLALGAIRELRAHGLDVPGEVSVVGFDDIDVAAFFDPPLTTVRQPMQSVGALAASLVINEATHQARGRKRLHLLQATVIARESVVPQARSTA
jgi:DNA-binding LacI/PurR family transcriptional regulator